MFCNLDRIFIQWIKSVSKTTHTCTIYCRLLSKYFEQGRNMKSYWTKSKQCSSSVVDMAFHPSLSPPPYPLQYQLGAGDSSG